MTFCLSAGQEGDGPQGRRLLKSLGPTPRNVYLAMDRAYEGDEARAVAKKQGFTAVVPPKRDRREPWEYDRELYRRRNEVERLFRRLKGFRRVFTRYDKLDEMFTAFILLALIYEALRVFC